MRRAILALLLLALVVSSLPAVAQQPDVQVRLFSLYHFSSLNVGQAGDSAQMRMCRTCTPVKIGDPLQLSARGDSVAVSGQAVRVVRMRGSIRLQAPGAPEWNVSSPLTVRARRGELVVVASMPMEEYVAAVVQGESAGAMPSEALKALAVTVRTYATRFRPRHQLDGFDFCDSTHCQHLKPTSQAAVRHAVNATRGELLWDRGSPAAAFHHQDCGGKRASAREVWPDVDGRYLDAREDPYCLRAKREWTSTISNNDLQRALAASGIQLPKGWSRVAIARRTASGRAGLLRFDSASGRGPEVSASALRFAVGRSLGWNVLKSDLYDITQSPEQITFTGRGSGHGVGLCQLGAIQMATEGKSYREILDFYFPGTKLGVSAQGIEWKKISGNRVDLFIPRDGKDVELLPIAERLLREAEQRTGLSVANRPAIRIYATTAMFRDATGEPGWVAASTRAGTIRLQPVAVLRRRGQLESSLRHEFFHLLIETHARAGLPLWFREGLVLYLTGETTPAPRRLTPDALERTLSGRENASALRDAYAQAAAQVADAVRTYGERAVIDWLRTGVPTSFTAGG
ncbi:MAG TPA: SpoIID/LytB domain-containing protein [Terriglobales bacterium]|nr:SpoIID/LytB domain-containing protein [Terriglobales bacterium]